MWIRWGGVEKGSGRGSQREDWNEGYNERRGVFCKTVDSKLLSVEVYFGQYDLRRARGAVSFSHVKDGPEEAKVAWLTLPAS